MQAPSLADRAYLEIRDLIVSLKLPPGDLIDERRLVQSLGIGRTPVREALRRLAQEQLVEVFPRRGMFVTGVDVRDLARISEVRAALEPEAARFAAERATDEEREELAALGDEIARGADLMGLDERIHRAVYAAAHNDLLEKTLGEYYVLALRIWMIALDRAQELEEAVEAHRDLIEAIVVGDARPRSQGHARPRRELRSRDAKGPGERVKVVVIGGGIVGNSLAGWLTELGWTDLTQVDKGPFPNPGGSTGHASNFIFPVDHSKEMTQLTLESMRQYRETGTLHECGGIEVARTEERMEELRRRMASAKSWGVEDCRLVTPAEIKELVPFVDESILLGGFYTPSVAVVDSLRFGTIMRERAQQRGAEVLANTEVEGIDVEDGRVRRVRTTRGDLDADIVVIACGVWAPRVARMAGASIPLTPAVHQMIDVGPVPRFLDSKTAVDYPIVRDMDTNMYERQDGQGLEVGSYAHRPILHDPDEIPSIEESALTPTELPFTQEDFELQLEHALQLVPEVLGDESVGIKYAINGLLSLTPDGLPLLGETPEVKGLWSAAAVWVKEGPGVGKSVAEWMVLGEPEIDLQSSDVARFYPEQRTPQHVKGRAAEGFNKTYGIVHPGEQWESNRGVRVSPFYEREQELGAVFFEAAAWERPHWYASNAPLVEEYGLRPREHEWDARWWSPIINAEHLAMRERAAMFDLTAFCVFDVVGPGALDCVQTVAARQMNVAGRPRHLHARPRPERRLQVRPHDHEDGRRPVPGRHRRRARHGGPEVVPRPLRAGRADRGSHLRPLHGRPLGAAGARHPLLAHE